MILKMERDRLAGVPYEVKKDRDRIILRFFPKSASAKNPDGIVFMLALDKYDVSKLQKIIS